MSMFPRHAEAIATLDVPAAKLFSFLDDHNNLAAHMREPSWMMLGSRLEIHMDESGTRAVGSEFGFKGAMLGIPLWVYEVVTERDSPQGKAWETIGEPCLWVIGRYRMGFEIAPRGGTSSLRVYLDYALPERGLPRLLGMLFGGAYGNWCTRRMVSDARRHFEQPHPGQIASPA